jgi:hypothetical protein
MIIPSALPSLEIETTLAPPSSMEPSLFQSTEQSIDFQDCVCATMNADFVSIPLILVLSLDVEISRVDSSRGRRSLTGSEQRGIVVLVA